MMNQGVRKILFSAIVLSLLPLAAFAQGTLFVSPASGTYETGKLFSILINVDTGNQPINAVSSQINFDNSRLDVTSMGYSSSIFNIWTEEPTFSNAAGSINFSGGLPNPGFVGSSGAILRVTFKTKAAGRAPVVFVSGSVLANDGKGTNILDSLKGGTYNIVSAVPGSGEVLPPPSDVEGEVQTTPSQRAERPVDVPIITDWPDRVEEGDLVTIRGLGLPNGRILVSVQKGSGDSSIEETFAGADGRFSFTYSKSTQAGFYRMWAKNVSPDGVISSSSEIVTIEVIKPLFFRIGGIALDYASIIVTLLALLALAILILGWMLLRMRRRQEARGKEIAEAEKAVHTGFDNVKEGLRNYVRYLTKAKSVEGVKRRESKTQDDLKEQLEDIEHKIEKEVDDIKHPPNNNKDN